MKIALDTSPLNSAHKGRGIGAYTENLSLHLQKNYPKDQFIFSADLKGAKPDLIHYPYFDLFSHTLPLIKSTKTVVTIHDVIPLLFPKQFPRGLKGQINLSLQQLSLKTTSAIITDSHASKTDIHCYLKIPLSKIHAIYLAPAQDLTAPKRQDKLNFRRQFNLPKPLLGYVGDINYNKNLPRLIQAVSKIPDLHLAIVTRADINQLIPEAKAIKQAISSTHSSKQVHLLSIDSSKQLACFYSYIDFLIQPSLSEGFGLPVLEAMSLGTPVISSNAGSLPEVTGGNSISFSPDKTQNLIKAIHKALFLSSKEKNQLIKQALTHANHFSWNNTAKQTYQVYQQVLA